MSLVSRKTQTLLAAILFCFCSADVLAHNPITSSGEGQIAALLSFSALLLFWIFYLLGVKRKRPSNRQILLFHLAAILCGLAVLGPLDDWAKTSSAAHMTQHMLLMVVIAPLWVLSQPLAQIIAGSGRLLAWLWRPMLWLTRYPLTTAYIHGAIIWFWHMPYFYMLAVENVWWHALEHLFFLITAGLFWWAVLKGSRQNTHWALLAILFTLMHTGFLGALLTFASVPLYGEARSLGDQQLAGLIMWVVGAVPYLAAAAWVGNHWYKQLQLRMDD
jgi:putative membrane protein